jgi:hypothetical protein
MHEANSSNRLAWNVVIAITFLIAFYFLGKYLPHTGSLANNLHGGRMWAVAITRPDGRIDRIEVSDNKEATHTFLPAPDSDAYSTISIDTALWSALELLRQDWCTKQPSFPAPTTDRSFYQVAVQCGRVVNPVLRIPTDHLPQPLLRLVDTVPPPPR